jgi:tRNA pseudouridine55 synthase
MNGVLVLDKPRGPTSFDLVARVRRAAAERRVGHAGTLDPMASGVLVICLGESTKLVPYLMDADKEYRATVRLGVRTDTDDADVGAKVIAEAPPEALAALREEQVRAALAEQAGLRRQVPPRYSALKVEGERLYDLARSEAADIEAQVAAKARDVQIHELRVEEVALPEVTFFIRCGKGTYVRSVARDLGERLGVGGHLRALRRLRVGRFTVEQATPLVHVHGEGGKHGLDRFDGPPRLFTPAQALAHLPAVQVPREIAERVRNGQLAAVAEAAARLDRDTDTDGGREGGEAHAVVLDEAGDLAAVLVRREGGWRVSRGFARFNAA